MAAGAGRETTGLLPSDPMHPEWLGSPGFRAYNPVRISTAKFGDPARVPWPARSGMLIGYARVSTDDQNLDLQRDALRLAGCEKVYEDRMSGAKAARPGLAMALEVARAGDVLTVWRLDRLGRSLHDLILLGRRLDEMGVGLRSLREKIDTSSSGGRPKVLEPAKRQLAVQLYAEKKHTIGEICRLMGISKPTLYNYVAEAGA